MNEKGVILSKLKAVKGELATRYRVRSLALFGSYARNEQTSSSDVDILVDVDPAIGLAFIDLADYLEHLLGTHVDLVSSRAVKPAYREKIEADLMYV
jgi:predicted nucleotidyltransferase